MALNWAISNLFCMNLELTKEISLQNWADIRLEGGEKEIETIRKYIVDTGTLSQDKISPSLYTWVMVLGCVSALLLQFSCSLWADGNERKHSESLASV